MRGIRPSLLLAACRELETFQEARCSLVRTLEKSKPLRMTAVYLWRTTTRESSCLAGMRRKRGLSRKRWLARHFITSAISKGVSRRFKTFNHETPDVSSTTALWHYGAANSRCCLTNG